MKPSSSQPRSITTEETKSYSPIIKRSHSPTPTPVDEYTEHSTK